MPRKGAASAIWGRLRITFSPQLLLRVRPIGRKRGNQKDVSFANAEHDEIGFVVCLVMRPIPLVLHRARSKRRHECYSCPGLRALRQAPFAPGR